MTQAHVAEDSKLVLIGAADIYKRLLSLHHALDERVTQVSLGAFARPDDARLFLTMGFAAMKLWHPWISQYKKEQGKRAECAEAIWEAANGLPKSLNSLGYDVALKSEGRASVTAALLIDECRRVTDDHCAQYSRDFPHVLHLLEGNAVAVSVVRRLYEEGIARIHRIPTVVDYLHRHGERIPADEVNVAIDGLVDIEFLVRTGRRGELVFVQNPTAAHTLGVVLRTPDRFEALAEMARRCPLQMRLLFDASVVDRPSRDA